MNIAIIGLLFFSLTTSICWSKEKRNNNEESFILNEKNLLQIAEASNPTTDNIDASYNLAKLNKNQFLENFQLNFSGGGSYIKNNEEPFFEFQPTVSPSANFYLNLDKNFLNGMSLSLSNQINQRKYENYGTDSTNVLSLQFSMDLYKDFFGKSSKNKISFLDYEEKIANLQRQINKKIFITNIYRIYLHLIFNEEAIKISQDILKIYQKQELDAKQRYKNSIADLSEVKRRSSQLSTKRVNIFNLENKRENLILELRKLLPGISEKQIVIDKYDVNLIQNKFKKIILNLKSLKEVPFDYTYYDEIVNLIEKSYQKERKINKNYADLDIKLYSKYSHGGNDSDMDIASKNIINNPEERYEIGLNFKKSLGKAQINSQNLKLAISKSNFLAKHRSNLAKIQSYHIQSIKTLEILANANKFQKSNSEDLSEILRLSEKKYNQARITIKELIDDQDLYLQSLLNEINIKILIIDQIIDYMLIFTNMPDF